MPTDCAVSESLRRSNRLDSWPASRPRPVRRRPPAAAAAPRRVVVHAGRLIDGVSATARERVSIVIEGDRITAVENGFTRPAGAEVVDLSSATVLPGLIDAHTHITGEGTGNALVRAVTRDGHRRGDPLHGLREAHARRRLHRHSQRRRRRRRGHQPEEGDRRGRSSPARASGRARMGLSITGGHGDQGGLRPELGSRLHLGERHRRQPRGSGEGRAVSAQVRRRPDQVHGDRRRAVDRRFGRRAAVQRAPR